MVEKFQCHVCGFPELERPAYDLEMNQPLFDICPCCGCEFGYNDATPKARERHLKEWIKQGAIWFKPDVRPPKWDLVSQLKLIGVEIDDV